MDCASCATKIDTALRRAPGVAEVNVSVPAGTVTIFHDDAVAPTALAQRIAALGYRVTGHGPADLAESSSKRRGRGHDHGAAERVLLHEAVPLDRAETGRLFDESLPTGLRVRTG